ncbi:MAG: response regulator transcription factor [Oscillospiraceae bacterium]|nr:response regulator transcription factor [Oscillospiraceae bacterium]
MAHILLIDDCPEILQANVSHLLAEGFHVSTAETGVEAILRLKEAAYDCIVLDIMLPDIDGFALCKAIRTITDTPVIFLTCKDDTDDKINGLTNGGDDYLTKPYSLKELTARIKILLRHGQRNDRQISYGEVRIDKENRIVQTSQKNVFLSQKEFDLFLLLFENPGKVFSKEELFQTLWPNSADIGTVAVHISKLRRKLGFAEAQIGTIENNYKCGYYIAPPDALGGV